MAPCSEPSAAFGGYVAAGPALPNPQTNLEAMKSKFLVTLALLTACSLGLSPISAMAAEKDKKAEAAGKAETTKPIPYNGKVIKVDAHRKTFTLSGKSGRVMNTTDT